MNITANTDQTEATSGRERSLQNLRPWQKGESGNPEGRPKGLARRIREAVGDDGERLVEAVVAVLVDPESSRRDRLEASTWLADRGWGRPTTVVAAEDGGPLQIAVLGMLATAREQADDRREREPEPDHGVITLRDEGRSE